MKMTRRASLTRHRISAKIVRFAALAVLCLLVWGPAAANELADYRQRIEKAVESNADLLAYTEENLLEPERDVEFEREMLAAIRAAVPATEKIEWQGSAVETSNGWIEEKLKAFETETSDWNRRRTILSEVGERLAALETKLEELEKAGAADRSKDEDKRKLAEILRREEYQKPVPQESFFDKFLRKFQEWLESLFPKPNVPMTPIGNLGSFGVLLQILLYAAIIGLIGFLVYRFAPFLAARFGRREKPEKEDRIILGERLGADENAQTLFGEAEALARAGDLRGAIRKGYIALLCELSDRKVIGLAQHKTNRDYLRDVRRRQALHEHLSGLTNNFERHWYGFETAREEDWLEFKRRYRESLESSSSGLIS